MGTARGGYSRGGDFFCGGVGVRLLSSLPGSGVRLVAERSWCPARLPCRADRRRRNQDPAHNSARFGGWLGAGSAGEGQGPPHTRPTVAPSHGASVGLVGSAMERWHSQTLGSWAKPRSLESLLAVGLCPMAWGRGAMGGRVHVAALCATASPCGWPGSPREEGEGETLAPRAPSSLPLPSSAEVESYARLMGPAWLSSSSTPIATSSPRARRGEVATGVLR